MLLKYVCDVNETGQWQLDKRSKEKKIGAHRQNITDGLDNTSFSEM